MGKRKHTKAKRRRDVIDVRKAATVSPTPEQMLHADYAEEEIHDRSGTTSVRIGKAYRRQARFETIEGLTVEQLRALRFYRAAFDGAELSETKSALDIRPRGTGSDGALSRMEAIVGSGIALKRIEARVPVGLVPTLRSVAGHDMDFKAVAIERFGGRDVSRVVAGRLATTIEPRSGRHRAIIREEFLSAAARLVEAAKPMMAATPKEAVAAHVDALVKTASAAATIVSFDSVDPDFLNENGILRPMNEIADIIREKAFGEAA